MRRLRVYSVFLEIVSTDGLFYFPNIQVGQVPDGITGDGSAGSTLTWNCQSGCLYFWLNFNANPGDTGHIRITTLAGIFHEYYTDSDYLRDIVIDLDTGEYDSTNNESGGTAGACSFGGGDFAFGKSKRGTGQGFWGK